MTHYLILSTLLTACPLLEGLFPLSEEYKRRLSISFSSSSLAMKHLSHFVFLFFTLYTNVMAIAGRLHASESFYSRAHFLGNEYMFDTRDGWHNVSISNLDYKYRRDTDLHLHSSKGVSTPKAAKASVHHLKKPAHHGLGNVISDALGGVLKGLKALGRPEKVIITWRVDNFTSCLVADS